MPVNPGPDGVDSHFHSARHRYTKLSREEVLPSGITHMAHEAAPKDFAYGNGPHAALRFGHPCARRLTTAASCSRKLSAAPHNPRQLMNGRQVRVSVVRVERLQRSSGFVVFGSQASSKQSSAGLAVKAFTCQVGGHLLALSRLGVAAAVWCAKAESALHPPSA